MTFYFNFWVLHLCSDTCTGTPSTYVSMHTCIHCTHEKCIFSISSIKKSNWKRGKRLRNSLSAKLNTVRGILPVVLLSGNQEILIVFANPISDLSRNCISYFSCCCKKICDKCILKTDGSILAQSLRAAGGSGSWLANRETNAAAQLLFFFSCGPRSYSTFIACLSIPANPLQKSLHRRVHRFVSVVILNLIKQFLWEALYET